MSKSASRKLAALAIVAAIAAGGAAWVVLKQPEFKATTLGAKGAAIPDFGSKLGQVTAVVVRDAKQATTLRATAAGRWLVEDRAGFPADEDSVRRLLLSLASLKLLEARSADPEAHQRMGVADTTKEGSTAVRIALLDAKNAEIGALLVGKVQSPDIGGRAGELFVRRSGESHAWLAQGKVEAKADPTTWLSKDLLKLDRSRIASVEFTKPEGPAGKILRKDATSEDFDAQGVPEGQKQNISNINSAAGALEFLAFADVARKTTLDMSAASSSVYRTFDGLVLDVRTARIGEKFWMTAAASFDPVQAEKAKDAGAKEGVLKPAADVEREAKEIAERTEGWAYQILDSKAAELTRTTLDFIVKE